MFTPDNTEGFTQADLDLMNRALRLLLQDGIDEANDGEGGIVVHEGQILDGRNRWRACQELGKTPWISEYSGTDPLRYAIAVNTERRALSEAQRAMVAERLANVENGFNQYTKEGEQICSPTIDLEAAADLLHVSRRSVIRARKIRRECTPAPP